MILNKKTLNNYIEPLFFCLAAAVMIFVRVRYADIAMERDEGEYAYAGSQILRGGIPYKDFYNMKLPGVYYCYALIFALLGKSIKIVRLTLIAMNLFTAFLLVKIGEKWINKPAGWIAGGFYMLFALSFHIQGIIANCEHFVVFFLILSLWFLEHRRFFWMSLCGALAIFMKQQGGILLIFVSLYFLYFLIKNKKQAPILKNIGLSILGFLIPFILLFSVIWYNGVYKSFVFFAVKYARAYTEINLPHTDFSTLLALLGEWEYFLINYRFYLIAIVVLGIFFKINRFKTPLNPLVLLLFVGVSYAAVLPGWYYRPHYYQYMIPAVALLMAYVWAWLRHLTEGGAALMAYSTILVFGLGYSVYKQSDYFFKYTHAETSDRLYPIDRFHELRDVGLILRKNKRTNNDTIGYMGNEPQLAFYADMTSASGYMYNYPMIERQPFSLEMANQYNAEIKSKKPHWFVDCFHWYYWNWFDTRIPMEDTHIFIKKNYFLRGALYEDRKLEWNIDSVENQRKPYAVIYERRDSGQTAPLPMILDNFK